MKKDREKIKIFAHRGYSHKYPENTMIAFKKAIDAGVDGIELDVQVCKSGEVVVIHDETINRTSNGKGKIEKLTYDELLQYNFNNDFKDCKNQKIPLLSDVLKLIKGTKLILNIEMKNSEVVYPNIEKKVIGLVKKHNMKKRVIISSFNHKSIVTVKKIDSEIRTAMLSSGIMQKVWKYVKTCHADSAHLTYVNLKKKDIQQCHDNGIQVGIWTIDSKSKILKLIEKGVDYVITNKPKILDK